MLPKYLEKYFWDTDFKKVDREKDKAYIIAKVLEYGNLEAIRWLLHNYRESSFVKILKRSRQFSPKSANVEGFVEERQEKDTLLGVVNKTKFSLYSLPENPAPPWAGMKGSP